MTCACAVLHVGWSPVGPTPLLRTVHGRYMNVMWTLHGRNTGARWTSYGRCVDVIWTQCGRYIESSIDVIAASLSFIDVICRVLLL